MKIGFRKPNIEKSLKAKTTGRAKRTLKKSVNPLYGKKGQGIINDPEKAIYNKAYNKTTIDPVENFEEDFSAVDLVTNIFVLIKALITLAFWLGMVILIFYFIFKLLSI